MNRLRLICAVLLAVAIAIIAYAVGLGAGRPARYPADFWKPAFDKAEIGRCLQIIELNLNEIYIQDRCAEHGPIIIVPPEELVGSGTGVHVERAVASPGRRAILAEVSQPAGVSAGDDTVGRYYVIDIWSGKVWNGGWADMAQEYARIAGVSVPVQANLQPARKLLQ